ncbi:MAG: SAM-dependent methyltransferase [Desulfobacteraceae bacterium 4572_123]|nr:MAG: SAM-dependent methyltransferase [Desulfobacteraceae bacterium 4572_123]
MSAENLNPGELLQLSGSYWKTCTLHAGVKLDLFTVLGEKKRTCREIADRINADPRALAMLLNALTAMELLIKDGDTWANTPQAALFLRKDMPRYIGYMILHHQNLVESWSKLDQAVKTGSAIRGRISDHSEEARENFLMGMFTLAMGMAPDMVPKIDLAGRKHLLDLGGGPGTWAIHFCRHNPMLSGTVYDLSATRPFAEKTIARFNMADRIEFADGNYLDESIPGSYDAAWLSHILHGEGMDDCNRIIQKTVNALTPGGIIIVHDFILNDTMDGPLFPALFALNMLLGTQSGQAYSEHQIKEMLNQAGVKKIRRLPVNTPNDSGIIMGICP